LRCPSRFTSHLDSYFSQRLRLHYVDWGNVDAPPMLLIHGGRDHCATGTGGGGAAQGLPHHRARPARPRRFQWMIGGSYSISEYVYDIAQLLHQTKLTPITIIAIRWAARSRCATPASTRRTWSRPWRSRASARRRTAWGQARPDHAGPAARWIEQLRDLSGRTPRRYATLEEAWNRMQDANPHLTPSRRATSPSTASTRTRTAPIAGSSTTTSARHRPSPCLRRRRSSCGSHRMPDPADHGKDSWAVDPRTDGRAAHFKDVRVEEFANAGHWGAPRPAQGLSQAGEGVPRGLSALAPRPIWWIGLAPPAGYV